MTLACASWRHRASRLHPYSAAMMVGSSPVVSSVVLSVISCFPPGTGAPVLCLCVCVCVCVCVSVCKQPLFLSLCSRKGWTTDPTFSPRRTEGWATHLDTPACYLSVYLSVYLYVCQPVCLSTCLNTSLLYLCLCWRRYLALAPVW